MTYRLEPGGAISVDFGDGTTRRLREPTYGEYRDLRLAQAHVWDDLPTEPGDDNPYSHHEVREVRLLDWWAQVGKVLADPAFPDDQLTFPSWMCSATSTQIALRHWREDPLAPGPAATLLGAGQVPSPAPSTTSSPQ